jgi:capsular exopolysaccharide synthesis family protein
MKLKEDILTNLRNIRHTYTVAINDLSVKNNEADVAIKSMPGKERQLLDIKRQQQIFQELYSYLLQKQLETSISSASTISNIRVIEPALYTNYPIKPNRRSAYLLAIALGVLIPVGIIFLLEYLNDKVKTRMDVERATDAPIIGEVGHSEEPGALVVMKNNRKFIAEQFRMIRTNFQYVLMNVEKPVVLVTSTFSGEGKSFISTNLGAVLAVSGKRTVILEFDIRKPKILKGLGLHEKKGITNFIVGNIPVDEIIYPVPEADNLFVIPCGPVPPNPAEMLLSEKLTKLFDELKKRFDTVIIDTAPAGLVSDAMSLGKFADATMYIIRYNYTFKKQIQLIQDIHSNKKLPKLSIIINDVYTKSTYGSYYGYGSYYAYGYGYAYGSNYFEESRRKKKKWWFGGTKAGG